MNEIAIVEKYPSGYNWKSLFNFDFDMFALVDSKTDKILKRDVTLDIDKVIDEYKYVILVGKEPCKLVADIRSVMEYQGFLVEDKYLAIANPMAVRIRPSLKPSFDKAVSDINDVINGKETHISKCNLIPVKTETKALRILDDLLHSVVTRCVTEVAIDTETSALYPRDGWVLGISLAWNEYDGCYIESECITEEVVDILQKIISIATMLFFNAKFDLKMLEYHFGLEFHNIHDVMLEHYILDETVGTHKLKPLAIKHTDLGDYDKDLEDFKRDYCKTHGVKVSEFTYDLIPFDVIYKYAALDAIATYRLHLLFFPYIEKNKRLFNVYQNILLPGTLFLRDVEETGIPINREKIEDAINNEDSGINKRINDLLENLYSYTEVKKVEEIKGAIFNVNSVKHVGCLFFEIMGLPVQKLTATGNPSCDAEVLDALSENYEIAKTIGLIKKLKKIKSTYLDKMLAGCDMDGRLRTNFNLQTTTSGRLSSSGKINAQQLPRDDKTPKRCIEAKPGFKIVSQDLKTAEMYIAAALSGDKVLQKIFIDKQDYHGSMAVFKFGLPCKANEVAELYPAQRQEAKTISFEILYKLNYREPALENFTRLKSWLQEQEAFIKANGYIYSAFGRKRRLADARSPNRQEAQHQVRSGINFLVQSVASDVNLLAGIDMQNWIKENGYEDVMKIFGLVHDSILSEVREDYISTYLDQLKKFTQKDRGVSFAGLPIGIDVEIGDNYGDVEPI